MKKRIFTYIFIAFYIFLLVPQSSLAENYKSNNIVILFDDSGSMDDTIGNVRKIDAVKKALFSIMPSFPANTNIGIVSFQHEWIYPLSQMDKAKFKSAIDRLGPDFGKTPLSTYIKISADKLLEQRKKQYNLGTYRLLIITDGKINDNDLYKKYVPEIMARGIIIDVIGVGLPEEHVLASKVHTYHDAKNTRRLNVAVKEVFAEIGSIHSSISEAEAFELIAPLPDGFAEIAIEALSIMNNQQIGKQ